MVQDYNKTSQKTGNDIIHLWLAGHTNVVKTLHALKNVSCGFK